MIDKIKVTSGVYWIGFPQANVYVLCGCPADIIKHLMKLGIIKTIEREGISFETGPNAILLSDVLVQHGHFSNLAEFPVLQMLYRQGMILPNHPNNTDIKPVLIGTKKQIDAQMRYIYCGNYGLTSMDEIISTGIQEENAKEMMRLKLKFAFGRIRKTEDLLDSCVVEQDLVEIRNGVFIQRTGFNRYEFQYKGESTEVDLNISSFKEYEPSYELGFHQIKREYFAVIHTGEGDGWDINHPCMASILMFQGKIYLIDAGPSIIHSLEALGISVNEIEGIFLTHAHDDHFVGLTTIIRSDHRIKCYATPLIRASIAKKLTSLMSLDEDSLDLYFETHNLEFDTWNNINGLEVKPTFSPHPVECNIYTFRVLWEGGYRTYAHFADIVSLDVLKNMITEDSSKPGITREFYDQVQSVYLIPTNIKKLDIGGGLIHGQAEDFRKDTSEKLILAHTSLKLTADQKSIGSRSPFGAVDVLIPSNHDFAMRYAAQLLQNYFPNVQDEDLQMLLNCNIESFNAGSHLLKEGNVTTCIYLVLAGMVEMIKPKTNEHHILSAGSLIGEFSGMMKSRSLETYCAVTYIRALRIPGNLYCKFVERNKLHKDIERAMDNIHFLQGTWLFGDLISYPIQNKIAQAMNMKQYSEGQHFQFSEKPELFLLNQGKLKICTNGKTIETISPGGFVGEEAILYNTTNIFDIIVTKKSTVYQVPGDLLLDIPIVQWKLLEILEIRLKVAGLSINKPRRRK